MKKRRIETHSRKSKVEGVDRLRRYFGARQVSFYYRHHDERSETLATAPVDDKDAIAKAELTARRKVLDIQAGQIIAGSVAELVDRFANEIDPSHYADQSKSGKSVRLGRYANLKKFFGKMAPKSVRMMHGYQYLDDRAKAGAPASANKDIAAMQTIFNYAVRWGVVEANPFIGIMQNKTEKSVRSIGREQVVQFYLWSQRQDLPFKTMGCAAMFAYLTGFRSAEVRPFHISGLGPDGVSVASAKRKKGEKLVMKLRDWSPRLRTVVARAQESRPAKSLYLFGNTHGEPYSRSGWGSIWQDAMYAWIGAHDPVIANEAIRKKSIEAAKRRGAVGLETVKITLTGHPLYFALGDGRPAAITDKLKRRDADVYDFAAHANPATTHKHYDRRSVKRAAATE